MVSRPQRASGNPANHEAPFSTRQLTLGWFGAVRRAPHRSSLRAGIGFEGDRVPGPRPRVRQNVWLEFGWLWSFLRQRERLFVLSRVSEQGA